MNNKSRSGFCFFQRLFMCLIVLLLPMFVLFGCGGGSGDGGVSSNDSGGGKVGDSGGVKYSIATRLKGAAPVGQCPTGGISLDIGIDDNGNGVLDTDEVDSVQYVCNGADGTDGLSSIISISDEPAGSNCANGGKKVSTGNDDDKNGSLDAGEVDSESYICNGENGTVGGTGNNGLTSLIGIVAEPSGTNCIYGGQKVTTGIDENNNDVIDDSEVKDTQYICNGAGGNSQLSWDEIAKKTKSATVSLSAEGEFLQQSGNEFTTWAGSGFIIDEEGYIVTANHLVAGAGKLTVTLNGPEYSNKPLATVVAVAECADIALLKIQTRGVSYPALQWFAGEISEGMEVAAGGYPYDVRGNSGGSEKGLYTYSNEGGIETAPSSLGTSWASVSAVYHSAKIAGGSSGGPLIESGSGEVIGVNFAGTGTGRNLAITGAGNGELLKDLVTRLKSDGENILSIGMAGRAIVSKWGEPKGIWVSAVKAGGKAALAGLRVGDIIVKLANVSLIENNEANKTMTNYCDTLISKAADNDLIIRNKVFRIEVKRWGETCTGEINGNPLVMGTTDTPCFTALPTSQEVEPNDSSFTATPITPPVEVTGTINSFSDWKDSFTFSLNSSSDIRLVLSSNNQTDLSLVLWDANKSIAESYNSGTVDEVINKTLGAGKYFVHVLDLGYSDFTDVDYTLDVAPQ